MSDQRSYTHDEATRGPISSQELGLLALTGGLAPTDLVWPDGTAAADGILAKAALAFPRPAATTPVNFESAPPPVPEWLPEMAAALAAVKDLSVLPAPPPDAWIPDMRRAEGAWRPAGAGPKVPGHE